MAAPRQSDRRLQRAVERLGLRRRDRDAFRKTAVVVVVLSALGLGLLVGVVAMLRPAAQRPHAEEVAADVGCASDRIQSLESWALARLQRQPVPAPRKQDWERSLGDADHSPSEANLLAVAPSPDAAGALIVGTETGEAWRVTPQAEWTLLASGLPAVQALLPLA